MSIKWITPFLATMLNFVILAVFVLFPGPERVGPVEVLERLTTVVPPEIIVRLPLVKSEEKTRPAAT